MKDLYRKLGVNKAATHAELEEAFRQNRDLADYASILLNEQKRAVYDRAHSALTMIGALRQRLDLDSDGSWFVEQHADFAPAARRQQPAVAGSAASAERTDSPSATAPGATPVSPPVVRRVGRGSLIVLVLAAAALAAILWFALN